MFAQTYDIFELYVWAEYFEGNAMRLISRKTLLLFFLPGAIFMGAFLVYPIIKMFIDSFFKIEILGDRQFVGIDNYRKAIMEGGFVKQLKNTILYICIAVSAETAIG